jgi:heterodisulfide reductase subunit C
MKCGKCSASCPSYDDMDVRPHQFASYLRDNNIEVMLKSQSIWKCLSCFACVERCPRDVKPANLIEAARLVVIRQQNENYLSPDDVPELLDPELPQQLLASAFRKYAK